MTPAKIRALADVALVRNREKPDPKLGAYPPFLHPPAGEEDVKRAATLARAVLSLLAENERMRKEIEERNELDTRRHVEKFADVPPEWAKDIFNEDDASYCEHCGSWMTVVRPGKVQCDNCGDGKYLMPENRIKWASSRFGAAWDAAKAKEGGGDD